MYVNLLSTYSDKESCHTSITLQTSTHGLSAIAELLVLPIGLHIHIPPAYQMSVPSSISFNQRHGCLKIKTVGIAYTLDAHTKLV